MVAIGKLIQKVVGDDKAKKRELALAIARPGTKTTEKALRRLSELMKFGEALDVYQEKLRDALGVDEALFEDAIHDTRAERHLKKQELAVQRELDRRRDFRPHIFMVGEQKVPSSITMCGLTGGNRHRMIFLDDEAFQNQSIAEQLKMVRALIREHQQEKKGIVMFFGKAVAYIYRPTPGGGGIGFDPQGGILENSPDYSAYAGEAVVRI